MIEYFLLGFALGFMTPFMFRYRGEIASYLKLKSKRIKER